MKIFQKIISSNSLTGFPALGKNNTNALDKLVALVLATAPLLQYYKGISVFHAGFLVLIVCIPYIGIRLLLRIRELEWKNLWYALPLVLFQVYRVVAHGTDFIEFMHGVVLSAYFIAIALGGINLRYVTLSACVISLMAGFLVIVQTISYFVFHTHLQLTATSLLLEESEQWVALAQTGIIGITGKAGLLYRPSAFFLEPSHILMYSMPVLFVLLLTPQMTRIKRIGAVIISLGLILSTSGMGIMLVLGVWMLKLGFSNGKENHLAFKNLFCKQSILRCFAFLIVFCMICFILPSLRYAVLRSVISDKQLADIIPKTSQTLADFRAKAFDEIPASMSPSTSTEIAGLSDNTATPSTSTAISGRTEWPLIRLKQMTASELCTGVGDTLPANYDFPKPGFFATMFKYGIIGTVISYLYYLLCACYTKHAYRWIAIITILLSFVDAQSHGTFCMLHYVLILMGGCYLRSRDRVGSTEKT